MRGEGLETLIGGLEFDDEEAGDLEFFLFFGGISITRLVQLAFPVKSRGMGYRLELDN